MNIYDCFEIAQAAVLGLVLMPMIMREIERKTGSVK